MPIERPPRKPLPHNYRPEGGRPHRVADDETWETVAKLAGISAPALIEYNFGTRDPAEVNWYLRRNVGCRKATRDARNWCFSKEANPGVVYLPPAHVPPAAPAAEPSGIWFGIGLKGGGHFFAIGKDTVEAWIVSYDDYDHSFFMNVDGWRFGPGLGGSVGIVLVLITSLKNPHKLHGHMFGGADFEASLGGRWSSVAKAVDKLQPAMKVMKGAKKATKGAIKVAEWEKTRESIKNAAAALGMDFDAAEPQVQAFAIPGGGIGLELSAFFGFGEVQVHGVAAPAAAAPAAP